MTRNIDDNNLQGSLGKSASARLPSPSPSVLPASTSTPPASQLLHLQKSSWNTANLPRRIAADITAATCAAGLVSPIITMIDRGIIERASSRATLKASLTSSLSGFVTRPHHFLTSKPFLLIFMLYSGTFLTANTVDTVTATYKDRPSHQRSSGLTKFAATSTVNMSLCLYKDSQFTKMFGAAPSAAGATVAVAVPTASYLLFALRDSLTVFASFNLPPVIAPLLPPFGPELERRFSRASAAQFLAPAGMQLFSTPLHLLGLDLYNRPRGTVGIGWRQRVQVVGRDWMGSSFARMGRIVPAFGVGGVVNTRVRERMMGVGGGD